MRIAVIGTGIAGLSAARLLHGEHDITVFEADDWIGGHAHSVEVEMDDGVHSLDTGFLVYNEPGYPILTRMFAELGVPTQESDMSFSVSCEETGLEYNATSLNTLFAQRGNFVRPGFYRMVFDILRFYRQARALLAEPESEGPELGEFLERERYSPEFVERHLVPMVSAIWSGEPGSIRRFPVRQVARFFSNHGFLQVTRRVGWRSVVGGSREYVARLVAPFRERIRARSPVASVRRLPDGVEVVSARGAERFDHAVLAVHSDDALSLLADPDPLERALLGAIPYQSNHVVLHHDERLLPKERRAWASWNAHVGSSPRAGAAITYYLNKLQRLTTHHHFCVSLNRSDRIRPDRVLGSWTYRHPIFSERAFAAQRRIQEIDGIRRVSFCGAWRGWGFHEDGARSAVECVARLREIGTREQRALPR